MKKYLDYENVLFIDGTSISKDLLNRDYVEALEEIKNGKAELIQPDFDASAELLAEVRSLRNRLLAESDWSQMPDSPLSPEQKQKWAEYRQALRDIPQSYPDFKGINWPTKP